MRHGSAWSTLVTAIAAVIGLGFALYQLRNLGMSLQIGRLASVLELEREIGARKEKVDDVVEETLLKNQGAKVSIPLTRCNSNWIPD